MAWETRGNRQYYYESERVGGRVVKRYVGPGQVAVLIEAMNEEKGAEREAERAKVRATMGELARLEAMIVPLDDFTQAVAEGAMLAAGYHRIKRGPWRKRRVKDEDHCRTDDSP
jgi:hypothetical protein